MYRTDHFPHERVLVSRIKFASLFPSAWTISGKREAHHHCTSERKLALRIEAGFYSVVSAGGRINRTGKSGDGVETHGPMFPSRFAGASTGAPLLVLAVSEVRIAVTNIEIYCSWSFAIGISLGGYARRVNPVARRGGAVCCRAMQHVLPVPSAGNLDLAACHQPMAVQAKPAIIQRTPLALRVRHTQNSESIFWREVDQWSGK